MPFQWLVDDEATAALWRDLDAMPLRLLDGPGWVADFGGGNGSFISPLLRTGSRLVTVDVELAALRSVVPRIRPVGGSVVALPFRAASLDAAAGRAILHHVPDALDAVLAEARRVIRPGGLVVFQEPLAGNPWANIARAWFRTERHDPQERPLALNAYVAAVRRHFDVVEVRPYFLLSYLLPHVVGRLPNHRRRLARALTRALHAWDERVLTALPNVGRRAAYVAILARRRDGT